MHIFNKLMKDRGLKTMKKAEFKASNFLYGLIFVVGVFMVLWGFSAQMMVNYGVPVPNKYNDTFTVLTDRTMIDQTTAELKSATLDEDQPPKTLVGESIDIIGKYFERGLKTVRLVTNTGAIFTSIVDAILDTNVNLFGEATVSLKFIVLSVFIVAIVFLILGALIKWYL